MKNKFLWLAWLVMYIFCFALGTIDESRGLLHIALVVMGLAFFLPGALLLRRAVQEDDKKTVRIIRYIAAASLVTTVCTFLLIGFSLSESDVWGVVLQVILASVSAPMLCIRYWAVSLFLWSCLLFGSFFLKKKVE